MKLVDTIRTHVADVRTIAALCTGAEAEARRDGQCLPGAEHLLLSALALPDGSARRSFERVGAQPDGLRTADRHATHRRPARPRHRTPSAGSPRPNGSRRHDAGSGCIPRNGDI